MKKLRSIFKLFCGLTVTAIVSSSCVNLEFLKINKMTALELFHKLSKDDLSIQANQDLSDVLATNVSSLNYEKYFKVSINKDYIHSIGSDNQINHRIRNLIQDDTRGELSFTLEFYITNEGSTLTKDFNIELEGFKKEELTNTPTRKEEDIKKPEETQSDKGNDVEIMDNQPPKSEVKNPPTTAKVYSDQDIYKKIWKRSFALEFYSRYSYQDKNTKARVNQYEVNNGTGWLLDYLTYPKKPGIYRVFLATNLHVAQAFKSDRDYITPIKGDNYPQTIGFSIGKSPDVTFNAKNNTAANKEAQYVTYLEPDHGYFYDSIPNNESHYFLNNIFRTSRLGRPQTIFAATDFVNDKKTASEFKDYWETNFYQNYIDGKLKKDELLELSDRNQGIVDRSVDANNFKNKGIGIYKDFAVISFLVDTDTSKIRGNSREEIGARMISKYILDAIDELKASSEIAKNPIQPNVSNHNLPFVDIDYPSARRNQADKFNIKTLDRGFIAGYPGVRNDTNKIVKETTRFRWVQNNLSLDTTRPLQNNIPNARVLQMQNYNGLYQLFHRRFYHQYGVVQEIERSSLQKGSSGSVVYSKYGLPIGIYWGGYTSDKYNSFTNQQQTGLFDYLAQDKELNFDIQIKENNQTKKFTIHVEPYNLIDGTNKNKYPNQTNSYRHALKEYLKHIEYDKLQGKGSYLFPEIF
ncbi:MIP family Ig-specific serine endopeptidase [Mycoplasma sp. E35C]|uniref:MIP family Ig-specific serine endopeptidase n=1 Tax=Mycoplasma sp. E35C TaxID=2801918 RepID=UPI001CA43BFF|nr:DUF31 family protein [Mycoplasma sp. E35C]QZX48983.1 DUF31 family protein [Mycoplasma sp. E35C]